MNQEPLDLFLIRLRLVEFKGANVKLGCVHEFSIRRLKEVESKVQQWDEHIVFFDAVHVVLFHCSRLFCVSGEILSESMRISIKERTVLTKWSKTTCQLSK